MQENLSASFHSIFFVASASRSILCKSTMNARTFSKKGSMCSFIAAQFSFKYSMRTSLVAKYCSRLGRKSRFGTADGKNSSGESGNLRPFFS